MSGKLNLGFVQTWHAKTFQNHSAKSILNGYGDVSIQSLALSSKCNIKETSWMVYTHTRGGGRCWKFWCNPKFLLKRICQKSPRTPPDILTTGHLWEGWPTRARVPDITLFCLIHHYGIFSHTNLIFTPVLTSRSWLRHRLKKVLISFIEDHEVLLKFTVERSASFQFFFCQLPSESRNGVDESKRLQRPGVGSRREFVKFLTFLNLFKALSTISKKM